MGETQDPDVSDCSGLVLPSSVTLACHAERSGAGSLRILEVNGTGTVFKQCWPFLQAHYLRRSGASL